MPSRRFIVCAVATGVFGAAVSGGGPAIIHATTAVHLTALRQAGAQAGRAGLTSQQSGFISSVAGPAMAAMHLTGVPASVTIAQAINESNWGQSGLSAQYHNLFGVKGSGPAGSVTMPTQEYQGGAWVTVNAPFRAYGNNGQSVYDHAELIATSGYYGKAMAAIDDPDAFANALTGVYATSPTYGADLIALMQLYNLYQYDVDSLAGFPPAIVSAIRFARAQLGKPYLWGGTGPDAFDCSGLIWAAYKQAGVDIPRVSGDQWNQMQQVPAGKERAGDLVLFAGGDGTAADPGHVGLVIGPGLMIEAYAAGTPVRISTYGEAGSPAGDNTVVGFTRAVSLPVSSANPVNSAPASAPASQQASAPPQQAVTASASPSPSSPQPSAPPSGGGDGYADTPQIPGVLTPVLAPSAAPQQAQPSDASVPGATSPAPGPSQPGEAVIPGVPG